jgi:uncharacterized protein YyaL (SSP411 family)
LGNIGPVEPFAEALPATEHARVYLCSGNACQAPTGNADIVKKMLKGT